MSINAHVRFSTSPLRSSISVFAFNRRKECLKKHRSEQMLLHFVMKVCEHSSPQGRFVLGGGEQGGTGRAAPTHILVVEKKKRAKSSHMNQEKTTRMPNSIPAHATMPSPRPSLPHPHGSGALQGW